MTKIVPNAEQAAVERVFASPANRARAIGQQQQGAISGQVPGTTSPYNQTGVAYGLIQPGASGDQVAAVGHAALANDGTPAVVMGNLSVSGASGLPPSGFRDGGLACIDADGKAIAGYSRTTGLWGFGGGVTLGSLSDYVQADSWQTISANGTANSWSFPCASPPAWLAPSSIGFPYGELITEEGVYVFGLYVKQNTGPTTSGLYATVVFGLYGAATIPLDSFAQSTTGGQHPTLAPEETVAFDASDVSGGGFGFGGSVGMPTDSTAKLDIKPYILRIAY